MVFNQISVSQNFSVRQNFHSTNFLRQKFSLHLRISFQNHRIDLVLLIDCTEQFCISNLKKRSESNEKRSDDTPTAVKQRIQMFKQRTLPMLKRFDEEGKLKVVSNGVLYYMNFSIINFI